MRVSDSQRLLVVVLFTVALIEAIPAHAQTVPTTTPSTAVPTNPTSAAKPAPAEDLQWNALGATAQCQDGTYFHGVPGGPSGRTCADHGGVQKWLRTGEQPLIR
jgi:hypothetical protein